MFEPVPDARFRVERIDGVERIVVPAAHNYLLITFFSLWLVGWAFGFVAAGKIVLGGGGGLFMIVWLSLWTVGGAAVLSIILWQLTGYEFLAIQNGGLIHGWNMAGVTRQRHYDLTRLKKLRASDGFFPFGGFFRPSLPPFLPFGPGAVKWNYGSKTLQAASGTSEAEGEMIVERLKSMMPAAFR